MKNSIICLTPLLIIAGFVGPIKSGDQKIITYDSLTKAKLDSVIIAKVGSFKITAKEFLLNYEYGPAFVKRGKDSKRRYLQFMINEKLLALDGYSHGIDSSPQVTEILSEIEGDLATEQLYKEDVLTQVSVKEQEIEEGVSRERVHISLKWLYAPTFDEIDELQKLLSAGASFDSLFALQLSDSVDLEDRFFETTKFRQQTKNPVLSGVVDTLAYGKNSASIGTTDGWYIVKIVDMWTNAVITESELMKLRYDIKRALFKRKADALSDKYIYQIMLDHDPVIVRHTFELLRAYIGKNILPPEKFSDWNLTSKLMAEYGPIDSVEIDDYSDKTLVKLVDGHIFLKDFLVWYKTLKPYIRFSTSSPQSFFVSLEQLIWKMVRVKLLVDKSFKRGLQHREIVKTQKKWWEEKSVYAVTKSQLASSIQIDEQQIKDYYEKNNKSYYNRKGNLIPFEKVKNDVLQDIYNSEWTEKLLHHILALKQKYKVEINDEILDTLYVDIENEPKAIDVYTVKKGGTFPRPAFPTIDYDWKAWY